MVLAVAAVASAQSDKTVWDGVYTEGQAARGEEAFGVYCVTCHKGGFHGQAFMKNWGQDKLSSLYNFIRTSMPVGSPGVASQGEYLDVVAYVLSTNDFPPGGQELTVKDLDSIQVVGKDGPAAVPDGSLIDAIGCLSQGSDHSWALIRSSEPVRTRDVEASSGPELKAAGVKPLGVLAFRLPDVGFFHPERHQDHKVEIKGFLDRQPTGDRIMVTSLQTLASNCAE
jgi:mono/diheme cytochrome c family protein